jgi:multidrug resistance protein MdtO
VMLRVVPFATSIGDLVMLVFVGVFLGGWVAAGDRRISYAGFQITFAFLLCVIQGPSPSFNMVVARDRVIGILLGNTVSYFIATRVWPVSVGPRIATSLDEVAGKLKAITHALDGWSRRRLAAETNSLLAQIASDIELARYEPAWIRPATCRLLAQRNAVAAAQRLAPSLLGFVQLAPEWARAKFLSTLGSDGHPEHAVRSTRKHSAPPAKLERLARARAETFQHAMSSLSGEHQHA